MLLAEKVIIRPALSTINYPRTIGQRFSEQLQLEAFIS